MKGRTILAASALVYATGIAHADKAASIEHYNKGRTLYVAESFQAAIAEFEIAYREFPAPEYLHDIGQAYRRLDKCDALGYFERYLSAKPDAKNRAEVENTITALRSRCRPAPASISPSAGPTTTGPTTSGPTTSGPTTSGPTPAGSPSAGATPSGATPSGATRANDAATKTYDLDPQRARVATTAPDAASAGDGHGNVTTTARRSTSSPFSATASAGVVLLDAGPVVMPPIGQVDLGARYRITAHPFRLDVGAGVSLARLPFDDTAMGTAWLVTPEIVGEAYFSIRARLGIVAKAGVGPTFVSGLDAGNPFTEDGMASSTIAMVRLHVDAGVAWDATDRVRVYATPGYQRTPRSERLASDISALHGLVIAAGVTVGW